MGVCWAHLQRAGVARLLSDGHLVVLVHGVDIIDAHNAPNCSHLQLERCNDFRGRGGTQLRHLRVARRLLGVFRNTR